jgi:DNA-binding transcriptional ArsR family regulator
MRRDIFQAIADPTRREIIKLVSLNSMTPNSLAEHFDISRQAVSKHIKILSECRLLDQELSGREIYYRLSPAKLKPLDEWLEPFRLMWEKRFKELDKILTKQNKNKGGRKWK